MHVFAIVPLRMVAEQLVYAVAYGDPDGEPELVMAPNPLDRDASFLEPFAAALDAYLAMRDRGRAAAARLAAARRRA